MGLFPEVVLGPANEIFFRQRLAEIPALSVLHAVAMQPFELPFSFNAFCDPVSYTHLTLPTIA